MDWKKIKLQEFKSLTTEEKKEKLLAIFKFAKDKFDFSERVVNYLSSNTQPNDLVMEKFYEFVLEATMAAKERIDREKVEHKEKMENFYAKAEEEARKDSEDADTLLDLINLI